MESESDFRNLGELSCKVVTVGDAALASGSGLHAACRTFHVFIPGEPRLQG